MSCTAFDGPHQFATGPLPEVALAVRAAQDRNAPGPLLVFDDQTGAVIDLDLRGTPAEILARLPTALEPAPEPARPRGRPRLGVVSREVTLLPRHWDWLAAQPGGASIVLRRLVEQASRPGGPHHQRARQAAAYRFMSAMAGDLPGFEEAARALFAADAAALDRHMAAWPADLSAYARRLAADPTSPRHGA